MGPEKIKEVLAAVEIGGYLPDGTRACLLCSDTCPNEAMYVGMWIADTENQRRLGYPKEKLRNGGRRVIVYQLCTDCFDKPTRTTDVETEILRRVGVQ